MKINVINIKSGKSVTFDDDVKFSSSDFDQYHIRKIKSCHVKATINKYEDFFIVDLLISGEAIVPCAYTLEDVDYPFNIEDSLTFSNENNGHFLKEDDVYQINNNFIEPDDIIHSLLVSSIPLKVIKKGAKLPEGGDGYRVIDEDTRNKEKEENKKLNSPFAKLDNLDL